MNDRVAFRRAGRPALLAALVLSFGASPAIAQVAAPSAKDVSAWVKVCAKGEEAGGRAVCLTRYEELNPKTGNVQLTVAVRTVEGDAKSELLVNVPTSQSLLVPAGVRIRIDEHEPVPLQYGVCLSTNCQVSTELTNELLDRMRKGKVMLVGAINAAQKPLTFQVPLVGFSKSSEGPPVDAVQYQETRRRMLEFARKTAEDQKQNKPLTGLVEPPPQQAAEPGVTVAPRKAPVPGLE